MKRAVIFARLDTDGVPLRGCTGGCQQGRTACDCSELANTTPLRPRSVVWVRPAITVHRVPFGRRVRRFVRALLSFLCAPRFRG